MNELMTSIHEFLQISSFFGVSITFIAFGIGTWVKKHLKLALFNPILVAVILIIAVLIGLDVDYATYKSGANFISILLTPATICLAVPLYEQWDMLKKNYRAVAAGIISGVLISLSTIFLLALLFHLDHRAYVTLLPKSITTAIGMGVSEELGGVCIHHCGGYRLYRYYREYACRNCLSMVSYHGSRCKGDRYWDSLPRHRYIESHGTG